MKNYNVLNDVCLKPGPSGAGLSLHTQPMDFLDRECLKFIQDNHLNNADFHALDIGGGAGKHTIRMAQMGVRVTLVDRQDPSKNIDLVEEKGVVKKGLINLVQKEFTDVDIEKELKPYHLIYSQRAINYLPFEDFMTLLTALRQNAESGSRLYLSVSGYENEFAQTMPTRDEPLESRYGYLGCEKMKEKHNIYGKTLVFKQEEIEEILTKLGFTIERIETSTFGNVKTIAHL